MEKYMNIVVTESYAEDVLQDLANKNAIRIVEDENADYEVPEWQKKEVLNRVKELEKSSFKGYTPEEFEKMWDEDEKI